MVVLSVGDYGGVGGKIFHLMNQLPLGAVANFTSITNREHIELSETRTPAKPAAGRKAGNSSSSVLDVFPVRRLLV